MNHSHDVSKSLTDVDNHGTDSHFHVPSGSLQQEEPNVRDFSTTTATAPSSSSHRFVTISGAEALQNEIRRARGISTGLASLDAVLIPAGSSSRNRSRSISSSSGIRRGHVTEIYGPPGVGKTTFGLQLASNVLCEDGAEGGEAVVVWLSTGSPLVQRRLADIIAFVRPRDDDDNYNDDNDDNDDDDDVSNNNDNNAQTRINRYLARFHYREVASLPHILTLVMHPTPLFPPPNTRLLIIDDLSNLILSSLPWTPAPDKKFVDNAAATATLKRDPARRIQTIESLSSGLSSLAASRQLAVVVLNKCTTTLQPGTRAVLRPALVGQAWDSGIYARIVLYRDYTVPRPCYHAELHDGEEKRVGERRECRLAEVVRLGHRDVAPAAYASGRGSVGGGGAVPFVIDRDGGMREVEVEVQANAVMGSCGQEGGRGGEEAVDHADQNAWAASPPPSDPLHLLPVPDGDCDGDGHDDDQVHHLEDGAPATETAPRLLLNSAADSPPRHQQQEQQQQQQHYHHSHKRKITEIADSDDDNGGGDGDDDDDKEEEEEAKVGEEEVPLPPPPPSPAVPISSVSSISSH